MYKIAFLMPWYDQDMKHIANRTFLVLYTALKNDSRFSVYKPTTLQEYAQADLAIVPRIAGFHLLKDRGPFKDLYREIYGNYRSVKLKIPLFFYHLDVQSHHMDGMTDWYQRNCDILMVPALRPYSYITNSLEQFYVPYCTEIIPSDEKLDNCISFPCNVSHVSTQSQYSLTRVGKFFDIVRDNPTVEFHVYGNGWSRSKNDVPSNVVLKGACHDETPYKKYKYVLDLHPESLGESDNTLSNVEYLLPNWEDKYMVSDRIYYTVSALAHPITDKVWIQKYVPSTIHVSNLKNAIHSGTYDLKQLMRDRKRFLPTNAMVATCNRLYDMLQSSYQKILSRREGIKKNLSPSQSRYMRIFGTTDFGSTAPSGCPGFGSVNRNQYCEMCDVIFACTLKGEGHV